MFSFWRCQIPSYSYVCQKCGDAFEAFSKSFRKEEIGSIVADVPCEACKSNNVKRVWPDSLDISIKFGEFRDRQDKQDDYNSKQAKDYDRSMKNRKKAFGSTNVNVTKSDLARREHKIHKQIVPKAQGTSGDIDKSEFIKMAAKNPNAVAAAETVLKKSGRSA